jgi:hypothetical protein
MIVGIFHFHGMNSAHPPTSPPSKTAQQTAASCLPIQTRSRPTEIITHRLGWRGGMLEVTRSA